MQKKVKHLRTGVTLEQWLLQFLKVLDSCCHGNCVKVRKLLEAGLESCGFECVLPSACYRLLNASP